MVSRHWRNQRQGTFSNPGWGRPFQRGDFKYIILQCIKDKPSYGYEIIRTLQERFYNFYIPSPGSVYPTLQMLEEIGYVTANEKEGKKVYSITEEGRKFLGSQKQCESRTKGSTPRWLNPEKLDDIIATRHQFEKLTQLLRDKARTADTEKLGRIRQALSHAYDEISKD